MLQGALVLANTLPYMPEGVHLAVVDPGVGSDRRGARAPRRVTGGSTSGPTTACSCPRPRSSAGSTAPGSSTNRGVHARAGLADVPRPRRLRAGGRPSRGRRRPGRARAARSSPRRSSGSSCPSRRSASRGSARPCSSSTASGTSSSTCRRADLERAGIVPGRAGRARPRRRPLLRDRRARRSRTLGRATSSSTRTPTGTSRVAITGGNAAEMFSIRAGPATDDPRRRLNRRTLRTSARGR